MSIGPGSQDRPPWERGSLRTAVVCKTQPLSLSRSLAQHRRLRRDERALRGARGGTQYFPHTAWGAFSLTDGGCDVVKDAPKSPGDPCRVGGGGPGDGGGGRASGLCGSLTGGGGRRSRGRKGRWAVTLPDGAQDGAAPG